MRMRSLDRACRANAELSCLVRLCVQRLDKVARSNLHPRRQSCRQDRFRLHPILEVVRILQRLAQDRLDRRMDIE